jgi:hypothetical protein
MTYRRKDALNKKHTTAPTADRRGREGDIEVVIRNGNKVIVA